MRTAPSSIVRKFSSRVETDIAYHKELCLAVYGKKRQASLETMLSEQFVLNTAVLWEAFLSDVLIAYLAKSPSKYCVSVVGRMRQSLRERYGSTAARFATIRAPRTLSLASSAAVADPREYNITVASADALTSKANELLAASYAQKFALTSEDAAFVDFVIALRNFLGHRSKAARTRLKERLAGLAGSNVEFCGNLGEVGSYLKATATTGETRAVALARRLVYVANSFL